MKNKQREIKFRAWDIKNKCWANLNELSDWDSASFTACIGFGNEKYPYTTFRINSDERYIIQQYTNLKDKNGKEIYEGDVCRVVFPNDAIVMGIIEYDNLTYKLKQIKQSSEAIKHGYTDYIKYWDDGDNDWYSLEQIFWDEIEILGNIYENPELLEDKK